MSSNADGWMRDPFSPPAPAETPPPQPVREGLPSDLDYLNKAALIALAEARGLDTSGTRADLIARLRHHHGED